MCVCVFIGMCGGAYIHVHMCVILELCLRSTSIAVLFIY